MSAAPPPTPGPATTEAERPPWRECVDTVEVSDARLLAAPLFRRSFGHPVPPMPRHYVMFYRAPADDAAMPVSRS